MIFKGDFLGFSFDGRHSSEFGIVRVSSGDRQSSYAFSDFSDSSMSVPGKDGEYYFGTSVGAKMISLSIAFEDVSDKQMHDMVQWLNPRKFGDLSLDETPYKSHYAKISSTPSINFVPFNGDTTNETVYRGEGTITFKAYEPFAMCRNPILESYTDESGTPWSATYLPPWIWSGQLIPETTLTTTGWHQPKLNNEMYIAGTERCLFDIWFEFYTAEEIGASLSGVVSEYEADLVLTKNSIKRVEGNILTVNTELATQINRRTVIVDTLLSNSEKLSLLDREVIELQGKILLLRNKRVTTESQKFSAEDKKTEQEQELVGIKEMIERDTTILNGLLAIPSPTAEKLDQIDELRRKLAVLSSQKTLKEKEIEASCNEIIKLIDTMEGLRLEIESLTVELNTKRGLVGTIGAENTTLRSELVTVEQKITARQNELDSYHKELQRLKDKRDELIRAIANFGTQGISLDGGQVVITRTAQEGLLEQKTVITLKEELKGKTLRLNANTGDMCYYDTNGNRFDYFDEVDGEPIYANPTGILSVDKAVFNAGAEGSNVITVENSEKTSNYIGKYIFFKEAHKNTHTETKIINVREGSKRTELVLEKTYSLTKGEQGVIILNNTVNVNFSDVRYVKKVNIAHPFRYY